MSNKKPKQSTLVRLQEALKDTDGHRETVFLLYANHVTKRFQNGVVGDPNVMHGIFDYMLSNFDKGIADQPTKMFMLTMLTALATHYEPGEFEKKLADIRADLENIANREKN